MSNVSVRVRAALEHLQAGRLPAAEQLLRQVIESHPDQVAAQGLLGIVLGRQQRWAEANENGYFKNEIVPVPIPGRKGEVKMVEVDEHPRPDTTLEALAKLKPIVTPTGTVTAGNASGMNDAGAALVLMSARRARELRRSRHLYADCRKRVRMLLQHD